VSEFQRPPLPNLLSRTHAINLLAFSQPKYLWKDIL